MVPSGNGFITWGGVWKEILHHFLGCRKYAVECPRVLIQKKDIMFYWPFTSIGLAERTFPSYTFIGREYRHRPSVNSALRINLLSVDPDFEKLGGTQQPRGSRLNLIVVNANYFYIVWRIPIEINKDFQISHYYAFLTSSFDFSMWKLMDNGVEWVMQWYDVKGDPWKKNQLRNAWLDNK